MNSPKDIAAGLSEALVLPQKVSPNGKEIWDWAARLGNAVQHEAKERELLAKINSPLRCGDCKHWMKSHDCPREKRINGRPSGPSMHGLKCGKFAESNQSVAFRDKAKAELDAHRQAVRNHLLGKE